LCVCPGLIKLVTVIADSERTYDREGCLDRAKHSRTSWRTPFADSESAGSGGHTVFGNPARQRNHLSPVATSYGQLSSSKSSYQRVTLASIELITISTITSNGWLLGRPGWPAPLRRSTLPCHGPARRVGAGMATRASRQGLSYSGTVATVSIRYFVILVDTTAPTTHNVSRDALLVSSCRKFLSARSTRIAKF
jgi:hypothetical protein